MARDPRQRTSTERSPHTVGQAPAGVAGERVAVGCAICGRWIFHEARHDCELTADERRDREHWRAARIAQLRFLGVDLAVDL